MKLTMSCVGLAGLAFLSGCIPSESLQSGQLDAAWSLSQNIGSIAAYEQPSIAGRRLPARWIIHQRKSVILSTVSIVRAMDRLQDGQPEEIAFAVSPTHTQALVDLLDKASGVLKGLSSLTESQHGEGTEKWAITMADTLTQIEEIARMASLEGPETPDGPADEPAGMAAEPLLKMIVSYLDESSEGRLLSDLAPEDITRLRMVLTQLALKVGFDLAGKQLPQDLVARAAGVMRQAERMDTLNASLTDFLSQAAQDAPPAAEEGRATKAVYLISTWGPKGIRFLQALIRQWDKIDSVEIAFRQFEDQPVLTAVINVLPDKQVRVAQQVIFQPTFVFRGQSQVVVIPELPETNETVAIFEPIGDGAVEMRFEGIVYGLAKLLAFPLTDGAVREVRVFTHTPTRGDSIVNVVVLMEATGDKADPRRVLVFQDVRRQRLVRSAFSVEPITLRKEQVFSYLNPQRRWTYRRIKSPAED